MNRLSKVTSLLLIQAVIFTDIVFSLPHQELVQDTLSARININSDFFERSYARIAANPDILTKKQGHLRNLWLNGLGNTIEEREALRQWYEDDLRPASNFGKYLSSIQAMIILHLIPFICIVLGQGIAFKLLLASRFTSPVRIITGTLLIFSGLIGEHLVWQWFYLPSKMMLRAKSVIKDGLYGFLRHPIYALRLLMPLGGLIIFPSVLTVLFFAASFLSTYFNIINEEFQLWIKYGEQYLGYRERVPQLIPSFYFKKVDLTDIGPTNDISSNSDPGYFERVPDDLKNLPNIMPFNFMNNLAFIQSAV